ncbi:hypothetical protein [Paenibacillus wynnii]|uniref:hypothetical protein n=1 Tax=Paenibacillus wynnii TaxID=268407 RepID=UPI0012FB685A|nr:hypothetical protein [Paenibacillus wynnii]
MKERQNNRTTERQNDRMTERQNDRTTEQQNNRTTERQNGRTTVDMDCKDLILNKNVFGQTMWTEVPLFDG